MPTIITGGLYGGRFSGNCGALLFGLHFEKYTRAPLVFRDHDAPESIGELWVDLERKLSYNCFSCTRLSVCTLHL